jgi:hypothetical protein
MGLKSDVGEVVESWRSASPLIRLWLALSFFLAVSSIASISDAIVKWRGFFSDSISFYRNTVREPLVLLLQAAGIQLPPNIVDVTVIYSLLLAAAIKWASLPEVRSNDLSSHLRDSLALYTAMVSGIFAGRSYLQGYHTAHEYALWVFVPLLIPAWARVRGVSYYYLWIILPLATVAILAAVNTGLARAN